MGCEIRLCTLEIGDREIEQHEVEEGGFYFFLQNLKKEKKSITFAHMQKQQTAADTSILTYLFIFPQCQHVSPACLQQMRCIDFGYISVACLSTS